MADSTTTGDGVGVETNAAETKTKPERKSLARLLWNGLGTFLGFALRHWIVSFVLIVVLSIAGYYGRPYLQQLALGIRLNLTLIIISMLLVYLLLRAMRAHGVFRRFLLTPIVAGMLFGTVVYGNFVVDYLVAIQPVFDTGVADDQANLIELTNRSHDVFRRRIKSVAGTRARFRLPTVGMVVVIENLHLDTSFISYVLPFDFMDAEEYSAVSATGDFPFELEFEIFVLTHCDQIAACHGRCGFIGIEDNRAVFDNPGGFRCCFTIAAPAIEVFTVEKHNPFTWSLLRQSPLLMCFAIAVTHQREAA